MIAILIGALTRRDRGCSQGWTLGRVALIVLVLVACCRFTDANCTNVTHIATTPRLHNSAELRLFLDFINKSGSGSGVLDQEGECVLKQHEVQSWDAFSLLRLDHQLSPSSPDLIAIPCHQCRHVVSSTKQIWPNVTAVCLAHDWLSWMSCDHYVMQQAAMLRLLDRLSPNMSDTVFFYDGANEAALLPLLDHVVTEGTAMFWDINNASINNVNNVSNHRLPTEDIIKKLGYFILSADSYTAEEIMKKIAYFNVLGPEYNWLVDLRFASRNHEAISSYMKDGDNTVVVALHENLHVTQIDNATHAKWIVFNDSTKPNVVLDVLKCIRACEAPDKLTPVSHVTQTHVQKADVIFPASFEGFNNRKFRIVTKTYPPFVTMEVDDEGNYYYDGLCIRLLRAVANQLHFEFELYEVRDGMFGIENKSGHWNGMIGEVYRGESDFAAAGLTINSDRETVVDFTFPYWEEPSGVLVKRAEETSKLFWLLKPLDQIVWICLVSCVVVSSFLLWTITRISIHVTSMPDPMGHSYMRCLWYFFGAFFQQGGFHQPKKGVGRNIAGGWWLVVLVVYGIYTGNLIAFLTVTELKLPFNSLEEMAAQSQYKYGTEAGIIQQQVFQKSNSGVYRDIWLGIESDENNIVETAAEGFTKVREEQYAFIGDMTFLAANATDDCDLTFIKETFYKVGFGFAMPEGWPYKKYFDDVIMRLVEGGFIERWRRELFPTSQCANKEKYVEAQSITLEDMAGNFLLLLIGLGSGLVFLLVEKICSRYIKAGTVIERLKKCCMKKPKDEPRQFHVGRTLQLKPIGAPVAVQESDSRSNEMQVQRRTSRKHSTVGGRDDHRNQNGGIQNGGIQNGGIHNSEIHNGGIQNGGIQNGGIHNSEIHNGGIQNGGIHNGGIHNGEFENGGIQNGGTQNDGTQNDEIQHGGILNGEIQNGGIQNGGTNGYIEHDMTMKDSQFDENFKLARGPLPTQSSHKWRSDSICRTGSRVYKQTGRDSNLELL